LVNFLHLNGLESHARTNGRQRCDIATATATKAKVRAFRNRVKGDCGTELIDEPFRRLCQNSTAWIQDVDRIATARQEQRFATCGTGESGGRGIRAKDRYRQRIKGHRHYLSMRTSGRTGSRHQRLVTTVYAVKVSDGRDDHWVSDSRGLLDSWASGTWVTRVATDEPIPPGELSENIGKRRIAATRALIQGIGARFRRRPVV
jgi:hypothetical protein